jgi:hypothetical protein
LLALATCACGGQGQAVADAVEDYIHAVAERDARRLTELSAGITRALAAAPGEEQALQAAFSALLDARHAAYLQGRDAGHLELDPDGIVLIRALNLGRGTYYEPVEISFQGADQARLVMEVRLAYRSINVSSLPSGTVIYLLGAPLGTVYHPELGAREPAARRLLETLWLGWDLARIDGRWRIAAVVPDARPPRTYSDTTRY